MKTPLTKMVMTPHELKILLHYFYSADDFEPFNCASSATKCALHNFLRDELLDIPPQTGGPNGEASPLYKITERGIIHVTALLNMPLPVQMWLSPAEAEIITDYRKDSRP